MECGSLGKQTSTYKSVFMIRRLFQFFERQKARRMTLKSDVAEREKMADPSSSHVELLCNVPLLRVPRDRHARNAREQNSDYGNKRAIVFDEA